MLVLLGVLFTIILAGLDNTIVSTVIPVALPELGGAHLYAWTFASYMRSPEHLLVFSTPGSEKANRFQPKQSTLYFTNSPGPE